jgi:hypothetical protein
MQYFDVFITIQTQETYFYRRSCRIVVLDDDDYDDDGKKKNGSRILLRCVSDGSLSSHPIIAASLRILIGEGETSTCRRKDFHGLLAAALLHRAVTSMR